MAPQSPEVLPILGRCTSWIRLARRPCCTASPDSRTGNFPGQVWFGTRPGTSNGTTLYGGASDFGTVYKLDTSGTEAVLHSFTGHPDGRLPYAGLLRDLAGNLYGTTSQGGASRYGTGSSWIRPASSRY